MNMQQIKDRIERAIGRLARESHAQIRGIIPSSLTTGKLYEAHALAIILENMVNREGFLVHFVPGNITGVRRIVLRSKGGPITDDYPRFVLARNVVQVAEVWTDVYFLSLSYAINGRGRPLTRGDYHELDVLVTDYGVRDLALPHQIWLGAECKNTQGYGKDMLRGILGVRRELSLLRGDHRTRFRQWPRAEVPASPPSCLVVFATAQDVEDFARPGETFGIDFFHQTF